MTLAFLVGRTPTLAFKEIEAAATILPFQWSSSIVQSGALLLKPGEGFAEQEIKKNDLWSLKTTKLGMTLVDLQNRLGGTVKIASLSQKVARGELQSALIRRLGEIKGERTRLELGISIYGKGIRSFPFGLELKKSAKNHNLALRLIPPKEGELLSSAQVYFNQLAALQGEKALEIVLIQDGEEWWIGQTLTVQNIESYQKRDYSIPFPDAVSGMLPPKLAQTMINLATQGKEVAVYDPFCGNGRVIQEARLMRLEAFGSDIVEEKVQASRENMHWISQEYNIKDGDYFWLQDATQPAALKTLVEHLNQPFVIAAEPYLGPPLRAPLKTAEVQPWLEDLERLYLGFFTIWAHPSALKPERFVLVFPRAKQVSGPEVSLFASLVDRLRELGYSSSQVSEYGRPDALVSREIIRLEYSH